MSLCRLPDQCWATSYRNTCANLLLSANIPANITKLTASPMHMLPSLHLPADGGVRQGAGLQLVWAEL